MINDYLVTVSLANSELLFFAVFLDAISMAGKRIFVEYQTEFNTAVCEFFGSQP